MAVAEFSSGQNMKHINPNSIYRHIVQSSLFMLLFALLLTPTVLAQSGRKIPNKPKPPVTSIPPEAEEKKTEPKKDIPKIPVLLAYSIQNLNISHIYSQAVTQSCATRLGESDVQVQMGKEMNRKEASDAAKKSDDTFVALIQLGTDSFDSMNSGMGGYIDPRYLLVEYSVFEPKTGKVKTSGRIYQRRSLNDPLSIPQSPAAYEQRLRRMGEEAADRIVAALNLPIPPPHR